MQRLHIFRAGTHTANDGRRLQFSEADLSASAEAYDPSISEAPIVVGHPRANAPAFGWVGSLAYQQTGLYAEPRQINTDFAELVRQGAYKKISASFYLPDSPANPKPGVLYLRHVGFLGAQPPAVKGLQQAEFSTDDEGTLTVEFEEAQFPILQRLLRSIREWIIGKDGQETADRVVPDFWIEELALVPRRMPMESQFSEPDDETMKKSKVEAGPSNPPLAPPEGGSVAPSGEVDFAERERELTEREQRIADQEAAFAERERANARDDFESFLDGIADRVPPAHKPRLVAFAEAAGLLVDAPEVEFAEGDETKKETALESLKSFLSALPKQVDFDERAPAGDAPEEVSDDPHEIARRAVEYQEAEKAKGHTVSLVAAVAHVTKG